MQVIKINATINVSKSWVAGRSLRGKRQLNHSSFSCRIRPWLVTHTAHDAAKDDPAQRNAIIASPTGTALIPTQGSWRPLVIISVSSPDFVIVFRVVKIDEVGFTAKGSN